MRENTTKHTAGPWKVDRLWLSTGSRPSDFRINGAGGPVCSHEFHPDSYAEAEANARLIAAAPELLEACQAVLDLAADEWAISERFPTAGAALRSVIGKAKVAITRATVDDESAELRRQFPFIAKWGQIMGSYDYYIDNQCRLAKEDNAPANAIYERDGKWRTTDDVTSPDMRYKLGLL